MSYIFKNLHFIFIHVPISMLIFSFLFDLAGKLAKKREWHTAGLLCLVVGTLGAIAAVLTGPEDRNPLVHTHEMYGKLTMILAIVLTLIRLWMQLRKKRELGGNWVYLAGALIAVLLVSYTGHVGGEMVHPDRSKIQPGQFRNSGPGAQRPDQQGGGQGQRQRGRQNGGQTPSGGTQGQQGSAGSIGSGTGSQA